jgi:hypothetical protein
MLGLFFNSEDGGGMFLWNVDWFPPDYISIRPKSSNCRIHTHCSDKLMESLGGGSDNRNVSLYTWQHSRRCPVASRIRNRNFNILDVENRECFACHGHYDRSVPFRDENILLPLWRNVAATPYWPPPPPTNLFKRQLIISEICDT